MTAAPTGTAVKERAPREVGGGAPAATWNLRCGDCLAPDGLASLADKSVDVAIFDPPYSEHVHAKSRSGALAKAAEGLARPGGFSIPVDLGFAAITTDIMEAVADQCERIVRRWSLAFCDIESAHLWRWAFTSAGLEYIRTVAWHKVGGAPQFTGDRPAPFGEVIVIAHPKGRKRWNGGGKQGWYAHAPAGDRDGSGLDERMHTTQKPVALMEALIRDFTDPGELILDPFAGSGTTLIAATRLGRRSIGWERGADTHAKALRRMQGEKQLPDGFLDERQGALFGGTP